MFSNQHENARFHTCKYIIIKCDNPHEIHSFDGLEKMAESGQKTNKKSLQKLYTHTHKHTFNDKN